LRAVPIPPWPGEYLDIGDMRLHVRTTPEGPQETAVFVHGLAGSATNWTDLMAELAGEVRGIAVDLPGSGHSPEPPGGDYSLDAHARAVVRLIERVGGPVHLFGNSMGGAISVRVAATRPDLVSSLTLISPALPDLRPRYGPARVALSALPVVGDFLIGRLSSIPADLRVRESMRMCFADPSAVHPDRYREAVEELRRRDDLPYADAALLGCARALVKEYFRTGPQNLWRQAARVTAPTLAIYGLRDRLVHPDTALRAARTFPDIRVVRLPRIGHVAQMEVPRVVAWEARQHIGRARTPLRRTA